MAGGLLFMSPAKNMTLYASVAGGAAPGYNDDWLTDGRPGRPAKAASGSPAGATWVITGLTAKPVSHVIVANHTLAAGAPITVSGGVSASPVGPAAQDNEIALNAWAAVAAQATTNTITVAIAQDEAFIGEIIAGLMTELTPGILLGASISYDAASELPDGILSSLEGYDEETECRGITCEVLCESDSDVEALESWWRATRGDTRPSVLIPYPDKNDAWVGHLTEFSRTIGESDGLWHVRFRFVEYPRGKY